jgi:hypothetical protein
MKRPKNITIVWLIAVSLETILLLVLPSGPQATLLSIVINMIWLLVGIVSFFLFVNEPSRAAKPIFFNFSLFVLYVLGQLFYFFVGPGATLFAGNAYSSVFVFQYLQAFNCLLLSSSIVYIVVDSLFANFRVFQKYFVTCLIVGGVFATYFHPFFFDPRFLYSTDDVADYRAIGQSATILEDLGTVSPTPAEIATIADLGVWKDGKKIGSLFEDQKISRASELLPYTFGDNYVPLVYKPLFLNNIYMNVLCIVFVFLFFGYQYKNDPPQGAYLEKIVFLFLPYCSLEVLHHFAYIKSVEVATLLDIMQIGQYLSLINLLMITVFLVLRLRFITSVKGEFYERELVSDAEHISRWRDAFDNLVVRHFLNPKAVHGRLFAPRAPRNEA